MGHESNVRIAAMQNDWRSLNAGLPGMKPVTYGQLDIDGDAWDVKRLVEDVAVTF